MNRPASRLPAIVEQHQKEVFAEWLSSQMSSGTWRAGRIQESQLREESNRFLGLLSQVIQKSVDFDTRSAEWGEIREFLKELSSSRATQGFTPSQVATFVFSLKEPLFRRITESLKSDSTALASTQWEATKLIDALGLYTTEVFQTGARSGHRPPAGRAARAVDAGRAAVGRRARAAADRHARQRAHPGRDGEPAAADRRDRLQHRDHRHHRRADRRYAGRAAPAEDRRGRAADGRGLHHQRHPAADRADHRAPGHRPVGRSPPRRPWPMRSHWR